MGVTDIEWVRNPDGSKGHTVNPVKGLCPVGCEYCYARRLYRRFKWNETIRFDRDAYLTNDFGLRLLNKPARVFVGSTMELFGEWVPDFWMQTILQMTRRYPQHTFIFLTKRPWELPKYNPWPANCWVGMSATNMSQIGDLHLMGDVQAKVRFVSFEPLLGYSAPDLRYIQWVICGQQTPVRKNLPREWVDNIVAAADAARIPVFLKDNLMGVFGLRDLGNLRQEWPNLETEVNR